METLLFIIPRKVYVRVKVRNMKIVMVDTG